MKCSQCNNQAMYLIETDGGGKVPLCLHCYYKYQEILNNQIDHMEREINFLSDEMAFTVGLPASGARYPERRPVHVSGITLNNIRVDKSNIGVLNTGNLSMIDSSISALNKTEHNDVGVAVQLLTQALLDIQADAEIKAEMLEILSFISSEAIRAKGDRRSKIIRPLLQRFSELATIGGAVAQVWQVAEPILKAFFSI